MDSSVRQQTHTTIKPTDPPDPLIDPFSKLPCACRVHVRHSLCGFHHHQWWMVGPLPSQPTAQCAADMLPSAGLRPLVNTGWPDTGPGPTESELSPCWLPSCVRSVPRCARCPRHHLTVLSDSQLAIAMVNRWKRGEPAMPAD